MTVGLKATVKLSNISNNCDNENEMPEIDCTAHCTALASKC